MEDNNLREMERNVVATATVGVVMLVICPFFTYRTYLLHTRVAVGDLPVPFEIERDGRVVTIRPVGVAYSGLLEAMLLDERLDAILSAAPVAAAGVGDDA